MSACSIKIEFISFIFNFLRKETFMSEQNSTTSAPLIIDVRSAGEFNSGYVRGAVNLPLDQFAQQIANLVPNKDTAVVIYCAAGVRADMACQFMQQQGYSKVSNGINAGSVALSMNLPIDRL